MASSSLYITLSLSRNYSFSKFNNNNKNNNNIINSFNFNNHFPFQPSKLIPKYTQESRSWGRKQGFAVEEHGDDEMDEYDDDEEEEEDRSLDLLVRFVQNIFKKVSKRARRAVRSVLPVPISPELVGFSVNGVIILAFMWVLKAFLEVVCTLGSVVFVSILLIRGVWSGVTYLQDVRNYRVDKFDSERRPWNGAQPAS